jgi:hypothetical protein
MAEEVRIFIKGEGDNPLTQAERDDFDTFIMGVFARFDDLFDVHPSIPQQERLEAAE